ncbi:SRPBCC family protein [Psychroserpens algicola]|uniref:SRPBCC family protein n=1 Tax=Psychroserpens algicola TaxID=1719034 RepID=UPI001952B625|nr:SRPBCC domain-containing protein [Psychroserpens algicola]
MTVSEGPIVVSHLFNVSKATLWKAITNLEDMQQWFFENIPAFKPKLGFKTQFDVSSEDRVFPHVWEITEVKPLEKIVYNWTYETYKGNSFVTFELSEKDNQTMLTLTTTVTEDFPDDIPEFKRESCIGGWNYFIKERLAKYLNS